MKDSKSFTIFLFLFCFIFSPIFSTPSRGEQFSPRSLQVDGFKMKGKKHRLTGTVSKIDREERVITVRGRRKELSFKVGPEMLSDISQGSRVRVYYITTPDKKRVVRRVKKINNKGETTTEVERGEKGKKKGEH